MNKEENAIENNDAQNETVNTAEAVETNVETTRQEEADSTAEATDAAAPATEAAPVLSKAAKKAEADAAKAAKKAEADKKKADDAAAKLAANPPKVKLTTADLLTSEEARTKPEQVLLTRELIDANFKPKTRKSILLKSEILTEEELKAEHPDFATDYQYIPMNEYIELVYLASLYYKYQIEAAKQALANKL